jgi:hypothetical protein
MTIVEAARGVTGGVDTHLDVHVAAALDPLGGLLGTERFETNAAGNKALLAWLETFGNVTKIGVELALRSSRSIDRTERSVGAAASPIPSMPSKPPAPPFVAERAAAPSRGTVPSRPSACSSSPSARPARPGSRRSSRCATSATARLSSSVAASKASPSQLWSQKGPSSDRRVPPIR